MVSKFSLRPNSLPFSIGLFLFSVYLLSFSGRFHVMDELAVFTAGHNLARHGRADINQLIWTNHWTPNPPGIWGSDGNLYTKKPPGISFVSAPLIKLGHAVPGLNAVHVGLLTNSVVTALTAALFFLWLVDLGLSRSAAVLTSLGYGLCTVAWVYARMFWESSLLALMFVIAVWSAYRATYLAPAKRNWPWLLLCGVAVGVGLTLRFEAALMIPLIVLFLVAHQRSARAADVSVSGRDNEEVSGSRPYRPPLAIRISPLIRSLFVFLSPSLIVSLGLFYFNFVRYGSLTETGYTQEILFRKPWEGAFGLLFSPGRGLFIYAPLMVLLFFGLRPAWRRLPRLYFWLIAAVCLCYWLFYGSWFAWGGTWGWGPRFLLPILPLLMLFVAEPVEWLCCQAESGLKSRLLWLGVGMLAFASLAVNLLGITVDFNEHFLRLGSNEDFVFNWSAFPPLAHWQILQEGLVDVIWLHPQPGGPKVVWPVLLPALIIFFFATVHLIATVQSQKGREDKVPQHDRDGVARGAPKLRSWTGILTLVVATSLTFLMMAGTAGIPRITEQAQADLPLMDTLAASTRPGDVLLVPMPAFGDVQEISTRLMAYLKPPLPSYAWIEGGDPRAIHSNERELVWGAVQADARRIWVFERWLTPDELPGDTAARLNQEAFPVWEQWIPQSGKLTLYTLTHVSQTPPSTVPMNVPFMGGLVLVDFSILNENLSVEPGDTVMVRLTWQATVNDIRLEDFPTGEIIASVQLLDTATPASIIDQNDRLLVTAQDLNQSPLRPGQMLRQGYGLQLPDDLAPGSYPVIVGLYDSATGKRLQRADGSSDDFLYLTNMVIE